MWKLPGPTSFDDSLKALKVLAGVCFGLFCGLYSVISTPIFIYLIVKYPAHQTMNMAFLGGSAAFGWIGCLSVLWWLAQRQIKIAASRDGLEIQSTDSSQPGPHQQDYAPPPCDPTSDGAEGPHCP